MNVYPLGVNLQGRRCVVVGAGAVAERRIRALHACGAAIRVVAPQATQGLQQMAADGQIIWTRSLYAAAHLENAFLVVAATDLPDVNAAIVRDADQQNCLVCRADDASEGNFVTLASVTRGDLLLTVSTGGSSPTLAALVREWLEEEFGPEWEGLTSLLGALRPLVQAAGNESARRDAVRRILADAEVWNALRAGQHMEAEARAKQCLCVSSE